MLTACFDSRRHKHFRSEELSQIETAMSASVSVANAIKMGIFLVLGHLPPPRGHLTPRHIHPVGVKVGHSNSNLNFNPNPASGSNSNPRDRGGG